MSIKEDIIKLCLDKENNKLTYRQIGEKFGLSKDSVRGIFRRFNDKLPVNTGDIKVESNNNIIDKIQLERQKLRQEKLEVKKFVRQYANFEIILEQIQDGISKLPSLPYYKLYNIYNNDRELVMMLSDIHMGENVDMFEINQYNSQILETRLIKYFSEVVNIAKEHKINKINLCLLGDLITGFNIFKSQISSLDEDIISQVLKISEILSRLINQLSEQFTVNIYSVWGNHAKVSPDLSKYVNYERLVYEFIKLRLNNNNNININNTNGLYTVMKIFDYNYVLLHGEKIDNKNDPYRLKEIMNEVGINVIEFLIGHTHHSQETELFSNGYGLLVNSSVVGGNDYSFRNLQQSSKASQTCFVVEKGKSRTATYRVKLN